MPAAQPPWPKGMSKPSLRALASLGVTRLEQTTRFSERRLAALHGMGPKAIEVIKTALAAEGKALADD
jgi:hypothetical protein